jgi:hypothetical protein
MIFKLTSSSTGTRSSFLFFASLLVDSNWNVYIEFEEFCTLIHCLASRRKSFPWRNVNYDFEYSKGSTASHSQKGNINGSAYTHFMPLPLLSAIGLSILASRREWLETLEQEARLTKINLIQESSQKSTTLSEKIKSFRVFPLSKKGSSLETPRLDPHSKSCFCGCRMITLIR